MVNQDKLATRLQNPEEYDRLFSKDEIDKLFAEVISYYIAPEKCPACMICARHCPVEAIAGAKNLIHVIDQAKCIKCNTCFEVCPDRFSAVTKISGAPVPPSIPEEKRTIIRKSKENVAG
jgi:Fe-S-cluster-containing hydrogenase component 2